MTKTQFNQMPDVLTTEQAAEVLGYHPHYVNGLAAKGELPNVQAIKGGKRRFIKADMLAIRDKLEKKKAQRKTHKAAAFKVAAAPENRIVVGTEPRIRVRKPKAPQFVTDDRYSVALSGLRTVAKKDYEGAGSRRERYVIELSYKGKDLVLGWELAARRDDFFQRLTANRR